MVTVSITFEVLIVVVWTQAKEKAGPRLCAQQIVLPQAQDIEPALHATFFPEKTKLILEQDEKTSMT